MNAGMCPDHLPRDVANDAASIRCPMLLEERRVLTRGDEANLVAVRLLGDRQAQLTRTVPHGRLVEGPDWEHRVRELTLRQREEEIRLVFRRISAALEEVPAAGRIAIDPCVMPGGDEIRVQSLGATH